MGRFIGFIDNLSDRVGGIFSFVVYGLIGVLVFEVVMRYVFDAPTVWAHEGSGFLFGAYFMFAGAYALRHGAHIKVDIFYKRFPLHMRSRLDLFTWMLFYIFCIALLWYGGRAAWSSVAVWEHSATMWGPPIWPIKLVLPIAVALMAVQGVTKTINDFYIVMKGNPVKAAEETDKNRK